MKNTMSPIRKRYFAHFIGRCITFLVCIGLYIWYPSCFSVLEGASFFTTLSPLHILWGLWMVDIVMQLLPIKSKLALGARKMFAHRFRPAGDTIDAEVLRRHSRQAARSAFLVFLVWSALIAVIGGLYFGGILGPNELFLISVAFYMCDLICVLFWCPFRLMMKNKCCTTCRIFNWDHLMMFSPLIFVGGVYAVSLVVMSVISCLLWEATVLIHPERFCEKTNTALKCAECTDKLCTQYCQKGRRKGTGQ